MSVEFKPWPKIPRGNPLQVTITEKINGTNACIIIQDEKIVGVQSRNRLIYPEGTEGKDKGCDNNGFAGWVRDNEEDLLKLGEGYHYGEWAGEAIQKNPHAIVGKKFFLFNVTRWNPDNPNKPDCCDVVPVMFQGTLTEGQIDECLHVLEAEGESEGTTPEGIVVYNHASRSLSKHTILTPDGKWLA